MASIRTPALRHLAARPILRSPQIWSQRRWAQVHDVRFLTTQQPPEALLDKYRAKLDEKAKKEGHGTIDDLKAAYADQIAEERQRGAIKMEAEAPGYIPQAPETPVAQPNREPMSPEEKEARKAAAAARATSKSGEKPAVKTLDEILDLEKARELPEKELTTIWRLRHANSPQKLCAVMPTDTYQAMEEMALKAPQFVLPVPHEEQGAEIHFLQWVFDAASKTTTVMFTQLAEYKTRGEFAQPHTTITHHLDLADEKGLVLMQGLAMDDRGVQPEHAKWLVMCLQKFYGGWEQEGQMEGQRKERADARRQLLEWFSRGDERFSVDKLLDEAERMG